VNVLYLGKLAHLRDDPFKFEKALEIIERGALLVSDEGRILAAGEQAEIKAQSDDARVVDFGDAWLLPGLVDGHCHFPQHYATASHGKDLLDWLQRSVFPAEMRYADARYASDAAISFVQRLLACGTTTATAFGSQFIDANMALFSAARNSGLRLIAGMTMMDRGAPETLLQSPADAGNQADALIAHIRGEPLLHYAVTPRFPLSCSHEMLELCDDLLRRHSDAYLQTHINESQGEIAAVRAGFTDAADYLAIYERYGLVGPRSLMAHDIHVSDDQLARLGGSGCAVCHCPTSNLYLGSGLFPLRRHLAFGIPVAVGTDIGAGTRHSLWQELSEVYKVQQLQDFGLDAARLLYLGTLGGARALRLGDETGNFETGKSADFWVLDDSENPYLTERLRHCDSWEDQLFCLLHLAGPGEVKATFVAGRTAHRAK
jgi:guanine deaminase